MPTIETIVGMHNEVAAANTDKVWAGAILRLDDGRYQFVSLYGPRYGTIRPSYQAPGYRQSVQRKYDQMYREKLAHGYTVIDWRNHRYSLYSPIGRLGDLSEVRGPLPVGASETPASERQPMPRREAPRPSPVRSNPQPVRISPVETVPVPDPAPRDDVGSLVEYIRGRTSGEPAPEPQPSPKPAEAQPKIRKARRLNF